MSFFEGKQLGFPILVLVILGFVVVSNLVVNVDPGYEGVLIDKTAGGVQPIALSPGLHFKSPLIQSIEEIEVRTQKEETPADASSKDLQIVQTNVALNYHPKLGTTPQLYNTLGLDYKTRVIDPVVQESVKAVTAKYTAEELITKRELVKDQISADIRQKLDGNSIIVEGIYITNFKFSDDFTKSIEAKQIAQQNALKAENDLTRIKIEAEQKVATAQADAKAIQIKGDALKQNPAIVKLEWVNKWDGKMSYYYGAGENMMMQMPK